MAFSAVENTKKILNSKFEEGSDNRKLACFAGLKVFSTTWVILGHTYFIVDISAIRKMHDTSFKALDRAKRARKLHDMSK